MLVTLIQELVEPVRDSLNAAAMVPVPLVIATATAVLEAMIAPRAPESVVELAEVLVMVQLDFVRV